MREKLINRINVLKDVKRDEENEEVKIINDEIIFKAFLHDNIKANCDVAMKTDYLIGDAEFFS